MSEFNVKESKLSFAQIDKQTSSRKSRGFSQNIRQMVNSFNRKSPDLNYYTQHYMNRNYIYGNVKEKYPISSIKLEKVIYSKPKTIKLNSLFEKEKGREIRLSEILERKPKIILIENSEITEKDDSVHIERNMLRRIEEKKSTLTKRKSNANINNIMYHSI